jgi:hypothetical protein
MGTQREYTSCGSQLRKVSKIQWSKIQTPNPATLTIGFNHNMLAMQDAVSV